MKYRHRAGALLVMLVTACLLLSPEIHGVWSEVQMPQPNTEAGGNVVIGEWVFQDIDGRTIIFFDPNNPPAEIKKGTIVIVKTDDGRFRVFEALHDAERGDPGFNPLEPNTYWTRPMLYSEDTEEYRWFHHYDRGDYVVFEGKVYEYRWSIRHNPNTETQKDPHWTNRWRLIGDVRGTRYWYPYKIYQQGEIVDYQGKTYISTADNHSHFEPGDINSPWQEIGLATRSADLRQDEDRGEVVEEWQASQSYNLADIVGYDGNIFVLIEENPYTDVFDPEDWQQVPSLEEAKGLRQQLLEKAKEREDLLAHYEVWRPEVTYERGAVVLYQKDLYLLVADASFGQAPDAENDQWQKLEQIQSLEDIQSRQEAVIQEEKNALSDPQVNEAVDRSTESE